MPIRFIIISYQPALVFSSLSLPHSRATYRRGRSEATLLSVSECSPAQITISIWVTSRDSICRCLPGPAASRSLRDNQMPRLWSFYYFCEDVLSLNDVIGKMQ